MECCKKYKFCFIVNVILLVLDNMVFYEVFYEILNKNFKKLLLDLEIWMFIWYIYVIKCEFNFLIEKFYLRNVLEELLLIK